MIYEQGPDPWRHCVRLGWAEMYIQNDYSHPYTGMKLEEISCSIQHLAD